ncbi:MAG: hypothetical protein AAF911_08665 [Planctomycetota bacterium]
MNANQNILKPGRSGGFSLVETAIATVLVGGLFVVAMNMVGASRVSQARYADREQGLLLAEDLLNEILAQPYEDPDGGIVFGIEIGESLSLRAGFDDTDDYHSTSESPPTDADGNAIAGAERFTRSVVVQWVDPAEPKAVSPSETGVKRVTVTVDIAGRVMAELSGLRTASWPDAEQMSEGTP